MPAEPGDEPDAPTLPTLDDAAEAVDDVDAAVARQRKAAKARRIHRARAQASNVKTAVRSTLGRSGSHEDDAVDEAFFTREVEPKGISLALKAGALPGRVRKSKLVGLLQRAGKASRGHGGSTDEADEHDIVFEPVVAAVGPDDDDEESLLALSSPTAGSTPQVLSRTGTVDGAIPRASRASTFDETTSRGGARARRLLDEGAKISRGLTLRRKGKGKEKAAASAAPISELVEAIMREAGALAESNTGQRLEGDVVVDSLWEHERGALIFGVPKFDSNALFPNDPPEWTGADLKRTPFKPRNYPLPSNSWEWSHEAWMIDMTSIGTCDENGWQYATTFHSKTWRGDCVGMSFVRRRRWVRGRFLKHPPGLCRPPVEPTPRASLDGPSRPPSPLPPTDPHGLMADLPALSKSAERDVLTWDGVLDPQRPLLSYAAVRRDAAAVARQTPDRGSHTDAELQHGEWRDAVARINFRRVARVLGHCTLDRERIDLFRTWLGVGVAPPPEHGETKGLTMRSMYTGDLEDLHDLLERRLDDVLRCFDYQSSRSLVLNVILQQHGEGDPHHRKRSDGQLPDGLDPGKGNGARLGFWSEARRLRDVHAQ